MISIIIGALQVCIIGLGGILGWDIYKNRGQLEKETSFPVMFGIGFIADFFDTLGIGSFAITVAMAKATRQLKDRIIPGTLNVAHAIPTMLEAWIFTQVIKVDTVTLVSMLLSAVAGAWLGAGVVSRMEEKFIQRTMGIALMITAFIMMAGMMKWMPIGGDAIQLTGLLLVLGVVGNFVLGALMTAGIGLYAPCMAMVSLLGMSPKAAFPIMMCSCAFLMPSASIKFVKAGAYDRKATLAIAISGSIGVLVAAFIVKELPLDMMRWLVVLVVFITSVTMIRRSMRVQTATSGSASNQ